jgi:hypothetical protein
MAGRRSVRPLCEFKGKGAPAARGEEQLLAGRRLVKQRLCASGMCWENKGTSIVLSLRVLTHTAKRRAPFW